MTVDAELWQQATHAANDGEVVTWFTNIHRSQKQVHEVCTSKRRHLHNLAQRWEHYVSLYDTLAVQHARCASDIYRHAQVTEIALHHIRELRAVYAKTLTAKRDYHLLVTNLLKEHIETQHHMNAYTALCLERRQWYKQSTSPCNNMLTHKRLSSRMRGTRVCAQTHDCSSQITDDRPVTPFFNRDVSSNWSMT